MDCIVCGDQPSLTNVENYDYDSFCQGSSCSVETFPTLNKINTISWEDFLKVRKASDLLIDVRPANQYNIINLIEFENHPLEVFLE